MTSKLFFAFLLAISFVGACSSSVENTEEETEKKDATEQTNGEETETSNTDQNPVFVCEYKLSADKSEITGILIKEQGSDAVYQEIKGLNLEYMEGHPAFEGPTLEDLTFDGVLDILAPESVGNANIYYIYWIYNAESKKFERNTFMTLSLPKVDAEKQEILSYERGSAAENTTLAYQFINGEFVLVRTEDYTYEDEKRYQIIVTERQADGTMKEVRNEMVSE